MSKLFFRAAVAVVISVGAGWAARLLIRGFDVIATVMPRAMAVANGFFVSCGERAPAERHDQTDARRVQICQV